ncbi:MAG: hypothetical protein DHS20C18_35530 [Saprospiraceae bacterium]|nr:MAG: hypothetical protein DHS20C18_35530 [Saprospiraceae bacterium]
MVVSIDSMKISKIITEVETDSIGNILDTLSIEYLKYDENNRKRFKRKIYWYKDRKMSGKDYFRPDEDLFYRESFDEDGKLNSIFETISNKNGRVERAMQIDKGREPIDTIIMDYSHELQSNGKVKKLLIKASHEEVGELISKLIYDEYENPIFEVMIMENDTMSFQTWEYSDTVLQRSIYTHYLGDTSMSIYLFGVEKMLVNEGKFEYKDGMFIKSKEINHFYDETNERQKSIEKNHDTEEVKYIRYLKEK